LVRCGQNHQQSHIEEPAEKEMLLVNDDFTCGVSLISIKPRMIPGRPAAIPEPPRPVTIRTLIRLSPKRSDGLVLGIGQNHSLGNEMTALVTGTFRRLLSFERSRIFPADNSGSPFSSSRYGPARTRRRDPASRHGCFP
jgi:hypothetical protein